MSPTRYDVPARAEWLGLLVVLSFLVLRHLSELNWTRFLVAFVAIDLIGYLPGAIAFRRGGGAVVSPVFHHLYNVTHSFVVIGFIAVAWMILGEGPEWAMLAMPLHLAGDRGIFGNGWKPSQASFEPARHHGRSP